ncbi:hypothetical protein K1719_046690 [Acacia pycnantha]|nr:hypothetical protein K1719_046690 [Acacia pycnantha]
MKRQEAVEALKPVEFSTKLSYDHTQSEELKSFFLLCACISKDPTIADLVKYCIGLSIFQGVYTVKEARDRTNILVKKLKDSSLLLDDPSSDQVTMHDFVRDAALSIAFKEQDIFTMRNGKLDEWPDKEKFERVFHVESNNPSLIIPDKLFEGMGELRVLILVGELEKLRVLSLSGSKFEILPSELRKIEVTFMEELETVWYDQASLQSFCSLDYVIVKDCNKLVTIFPNYMVGRFSSLGRLEVMNCKLAEKIFDLEDSKEIGDKKETNLWNLRIEMMPKLKHIWSMDRKIILCFKNLQIVQVMGCPDIENVFPISVANGDIQSGSYGNRPKGNSVVAELHWQ